jgi:hypothetical protein
MEFKIYLKRELGIINIRSLPHNEYLYITQMRNIIYGGHGMEIMDRMLESLVSNRSSSETKSYLIGFERGRIWASESADYFEVKEWSEIEVQETEEQMLPSNEEMHFRVLQAETPLEWAAYVKGWVEGVREVNSSY